MNVNRNIQFQWRSLMVLKLFALLLMTISCSSDEIIIEDDNEYITFTVYTPHTTIPTYAMNDVSENVITTIDVLAFKVVNGDEQYAYRALGTEIKDRSNKTEKEFKVKLLKDETSEYRFVVIANASKEIDKSTLISTVSKKQLLALLISKNKEAWNATSPSDFTPIPMWGETKNTMKINQDVKKISDITLLRSLVAIDVEIGTNAQDDFKLNEVYLFNRKTRGRIVPIAERIIKDEIKVREASMPVDNPTDPLTILDGLKYTTDNATGLKKTIYTYEAPGVMASEDLKATCIVVGGLYKGKQTYYRLDFEERDPDGSSIVYADLLRNHRYTLKITAVTDNGYDTAEDAFYGKKLGVVVEVLTWNMSEMPEVVVNGNYYLVVSKDKFEINSPDAYYGTVAVQTNYPNGWSAKASESWIKLTKKDSFFNLEVSENNTGSARKGEITVTVGNLKKKIKITQM